MKGTFLAHSVADKANFASRLFGVLSSFVVLAYGLSRMIEVPTALTTLGLLHVHASKGLQTLGVEPLTWFRDVLSRIPAHSITRLSELLPHNWKLLATSFPRS
jgi:hypothetical protein